MDLSSVVVSYRSRDVLPDCLTALASQTRELTAETVVVDNASGDGMAEALARQFPAVRVIENPDNVGYARAVNQGIAATRGDLVLVMNPDCVLQPGALSELVGHLRSHQQAGVVGPKILNPDGTLEYSARSFPDHFTFLFNRYSLLTRLFPGNRFSRRYLLSDWDRAAAREVDWLSGACLLVRRAAIERVGPMDEAFFMFNEDVDWCRRMKLGGWAVVCVPAAVAVHHVGASRRKVAARVIVERHRGMIRYLHKYHPAPPPLAALADGLILLRAGLMLTANALRTR
jgi:N-acetylglucosaminyl-diphospho-decaprenol L-rhamnosyltransferase